jgi:K+-sensing histidine kinase KdpD
LHLNHLLEQVLDSISPKVIVGEHGGKIWAQNNADGNGATFYFSLPLKGIAISYKILKSVYR